MDIRTILVNFDADAFSQNLAKCALDLGQRFDAEIIGVMAAQPAIMSSGLADPMTATALYSEQRQEIEQHIKAASSLFGQVIGTSVKSQWLGVEGETTDTVVKLARRADMVLTAGSVAGSTHFMPTLDIARLLVGAARPVIVTADVAQVRADKIVIGWKDTRESRRAVTDAMPFLKRASQVVVAVVDEGNYAEEKRDLNDLMAWLKSHNVKAHGDVFPDNGGVSVTLDQVRKDVGADLLVSGAYGHSRLQEWLLGGVTRDLLSVSSFSRLLSN